MTPLAIDLCSLGATFAQFFTPLRLCGGDDDETDADLKPDDVPPTSFIVPKHLRIGNPSAQWPRECLFNGEKGEIGLTWYLQDIWDSNRGELAC
jgi:hypothetical protein